MEVVIPKNASQITEGWIRQNTGLNPLPGTVKVDGNIQAGLGFLSNLCRISFQTEDGSEKNIVVKLLPDNPEMRAASVDQKCDQTEIIFYTELKPKLLEISPELEPNLCKDYGGKFVSSEDDGEYGSMLIMEDLKPAGYEVLNPNDSNWERNLEKILEFLAKLHCAGIAFEVKNNVRITQLYPFCMGADDDNIKMFISIALDGTNKLTKLLEKYDCPEEVRHSFLSISEKTTEIMTKVFKKGKEFACLTHNDLWFANILTAPGDAPVKIIDWQWFGYRDPTYEVVVAILTCIPKTAIRREVIEKFARFYYRHFESGLKSKNLGNHLKRSESEFIDFFNTWGICYAYVWFLLSMDVFPNDQRKLHDSIVFLEEVYGVVGILNCSLE